MPRQPIDTSPTTSHAATRIAQRLAQMSRAERDAAPLSLEEFLTRLQQLPRLATAMSLDPAVANPLRFTVPEDIDIATARNIASMYSSRYFRRGVFSTIDKPISIMREMLLYAYEAKPRPISWAISGYAVNDFIAYIYQDIALDQLGLLPMSDPDDVKRSELFQENLTQIKQWLLIPAPSRSKTVNTPQRHIRRRLMILLNRNVHQTTSLLQNRQISAELPALVYKLLERDDDLGYTQGLLRNFRDVRADFNALATFCVGRHYQAMDDLAQVQAKLDDLNRIICPSEVPQGDFSAFNITRWQDKPQRERLARPRKTAAKPAKRSKADPSHEAVLAQMNRAKSAPQPDAPRSDPDLLELDAL